MPELIRQSDDQTLHQSDRFPAVDTTAETEAIPRSRATLVEREAEDSAKELVDLVAQAPEYRRWTRGEFACFAFMVGFGLAAVLAIIFVHAFGYLPK